MTGFEVPHGFGPGDDGAAEAEEREVVSAEPGDMFAAAVRTAEVMVEYADRHRIYRHGGELVRLRDSSLRPIGRDVLALAVAQHLRFRGVRGERWVPDQVVAHLVDDQSWAPEVRALRRAPVVAGNGDVIVAPGYDPATGLLLAFDDEAWLGVEVPEKPTVEDAQRAADALRGLLVDVPFAQDEGASRANALAMLLTPAARELIADTVPFFVVTGNQAGTCKTGLARLTGYLLDGKEPTLSSPKGDEEETRKALFAAARDGTGPLVLDNVPNGATIRSASVARATTARVLSDRILGRSATAQLPNNLTLIATGNNIGVEGDLHRRTVPILLNWPGPGRPQDRTDFVLGHDITHHVRRHRARYLSAVLTLLRAWVVADRPAPPPSMRTMPAFVGWSRCIGGALGLVGETALLGNGDVMRQRDPEADAWYSLLSVARTLPWDGWKASDLRLALNAQADPDLPARWLDWSSTEKLGYLLRSKTNVIVEDPDPEEPGPHLRLRQRGYTHKTVRRWVVDVIERATDETGD